ncbi:MAG: hypothetical protein ORN54_04400, partial [Cyclobacteriaceae bacterium]|nr:hypothetical protein [Cyclobacteriaceae bacterium]
MGRNRAINFDSNSTCMVKSWKRFLLLVLLLVVGADIFSQDYKKQFNKAKEHFSKGSYSAAMDAFNALIVYDKNNPYSEYA